MGFPSYSTPEEVEERKRRDQMHDDIIAAAKRKLKRQESAARVVPGDKYLPKATRTWLHKQLNREALIEAVEEARVDYQWALYDKTSRRRPLYPRRRAISPSNLAFRPQRQKHFSQEGSLFFKLPPELRAEVYQHLLVNLIIELDASHAGYNGPPPSEKYRVFYGSKITDARTGAEWARPSWNTKSTARYTPHILPLLQSCRQIYTEAIGILYSENTFKSHGHHNSIDWAKYLLTERLQTIRSVHFQLNFGYPWEAPNHRIVLETLATLKGLRKVCIIGLSQSMIDLVRKDLIDEQLWANKKDIFMPMFKGLSFIRDVDIFLPIMHHILVREKDDIIDGVRLHGLTEEERLGKKPVFCACEWRPEKLSIPSNDL